MGDWQYGSQFCQGPRVEPNAKWKEEAAGKGKKRGECQESGLDSGGQQPAEDKNVRTFGDGAQGVAETSQAAAKADRASLEQGAAKPEEKQRDDGDRQEENRQGSARVGLQGSRKRTGEKEKADDDKAGLGGHVEKAIGDVSGKDPGGIGTAAEADGEAHGIAADDRGKKKRGEEATGIALRAGAKVELGACGVDDHTPLRDPDEVGKKIKQEDGEKTGDRYAADRCEKQRERQEVEENAENDECG